MGNSYGGSGGQPFTFNCPSGAYITRFDGRSGDRLDAIKATCSDGSSSIPFGGNGGSPYTIANPAGFSGLGVRSGDRIDALTLTGQSGPVTVGGNGGSAAMFDCSGGRINGISGRSGSEVDALSFKCDNSWMSNQNLIYIVIGLVLLGIVAALMSSGGRESSYQQQQPVYYGAPPMMAYRVA